jgi:outer membrane protein OmpA-like peptidoglycan-associated protein
MEVSDGLRQYRVAGEETPLWVTFALALLGILGSVATAYLLAGEPQLQAWLPWVGDKGKMQMTGIARPTPIGVDSEPIPALAEKAVEKPGMVEVQPMQAGVESEPIPAQVDKAADKHGVVDIQPSVVETPNCPPLFNVLFAFESARPPVTADLEKKIARLRDWLNAHPEAKLLVEGHTDLWGTEQFNLQLSSQRAEAVVTLLITAGASSEQLVTRAYGKSKPLPKHRAVSAANRRVSLRAAGIHGCPTTASEGNIP